MKPKSKIDSKLANLETEARLRHLDLETGRDIWTSRPRRDKTLQKSNSRLPRGETVRHWLYTYDV